MTEPTIALKQYLVSIGLDDDADFLREGVQLLSQMLMEVEVEQQIGASKHERTPERSNQRNGYRERIWETRVGEVELAIPKLRKGSYFPSLLEPRRPADYFTKPLMCSKVLAFKKCTLHFASFRIPARAEESLNPHLWHHHRRYI